MNLKAFGHPKKPNSILKDLVLEEFSHIVEIGDFTYGPPPNIRYWGGDYSLQIGKYCSLADQVTFFLGGDHSINSITTSPLRLFYGEFKRGALTSPRKAKRSTFVGNDVWIGSGATIMSGVKIGHGAVIGARAVVASDVPPYAVYAGNPARLIKYRFSDQIIQKLIRLEWWNWSIEKTSVYLTELTSEPTEQLLDQLLGLGEL